MTAAAMSAPVSMSSVPAAVGRARRRLLWWSAPLAAFAFVAVVGPMLVPYDPVTVRLADRLAPPGTLLPDGPRAWLGTDQVGKDLVAQVLQGARISLIVGVATVLAAGAVGLAAGVAAGYRGGVLDAVLMRLADLQLAFPSILLAILIAAVLGRSVANVIITLSVTRWVTFARIARASSLVTKEREFVTAALATGAGTLRLVWRHIVPFTVTPLVVVATVELGLVILAEASLSFLGLGTTPAHPSWGLIIANGRDYLTTGWWISTIPGLALSVVVVTVGQFGDAVRDYLDPHTASR
ncbi:MAG TPA: ABC transporter permease [bacterium]|nr:ABC transporter permease [bacterium]